MTSREFLKTKLFALSSDYPAATIKYYFDAFDNDHFVCVHPSSVLSDIIEKEALVLDRHFIENFPSESLSFIELNDTLQFDELVYEYEPTTMVEVKTVNFAHTLNNYFSHYSEKTKYNEPLYLVRKISKEEVIIDKEDDEFAFAA